MKNAKKKPVRPQTPKRGSQRRAEPSVRKQGKYWYSELPDGIRVEIRRYSKNNYPAEHFADARCRCGRDIFRLRLDDREGAAVRTCVVCGKEHAIGDSARYLGDADLKDACCPCGGEEFQISAGVALYDDSEDVRWIYLGCRCVRCGLVAVYGDWKNEFPGYAKLLASV